MEDGILRGDNYPNSEWPKSAIQGLSSGFTDKLEFMKAYSGAYQAAYRNGWLDETCSHMDQKKYWEMEEAKERAQNIPIFLILWPTIIRLISTHSEKDC